MEQNPTHPETEEYPEILLSENVPEECVRVRWNGGLSELPEMRHACASPLLTSTEERYWTRCYQDAREMLRDLLRKIPELFVQQCVGLLEDGSDPCRIKSYLGMGDEDEEEMEEGEGAETEETEEEMAGKGRTVREFFRERAGQLQECYAEYVRQGRKGSVDIEKIFAPLRLRVQFYTDCLKRLDEMVANDAGLHQEWNHLLPKVEDCRERMRVAMRTLVERNVRLVISIAWRYTNSGIPIADLIQEGNVGLVRSIERFDYRRGRCFSTYASYWIRQSIAHMVMRHSRMIRMPSSTIRQLQAIRHAEQKYLQENGAVADDEKLSEMTGLSSARIRALQKMAMQPISLQECYGDEGKLEDVIPDLNGARPTDSVNEEALKASVRKILEKLNKREQSVIRMRFGLDGEEAKTLVQISDVLRISSERVRQIEISALQKMRAFCSRSILEF